MDWSLLGCSRQGHITYAPDEPELAGHLTATTPAGPAWRCLRCGAYVLGAPHGSGPADAAPVVLRGKALRDAVVLRLFAVERFLRALLFWSLSYAVHRFRTSETSLRELFAQVVPAARPLADVFNVDLQNSPTVARLEHLLSTNPQTLTWISVGLLGYGVLQLVEGIGLWSLKRWGEYVAAIGTSLFLPLEVYELTERITVLRVGALVVNLGLVAYLVITKRLFGLRGGAEAYRAERAEMSLLEVERSGRE